MAAPETIPETDMSLLHRFADKGDEDAFSEIVRRYAGVVFCACHRVLRDRGWAEDVAQETFFRLVKGPDRVSHSLGGWLHRAATRLAVDTLRSERARHRREQTYESPAAEQGSNALGSGLPVVQTLPVSRASRSAPPNDVGSCPVDSARTASLPAAPPYGPPAAPVGST